MVVNRKNLRIKKEAGLNSCYRAEKPFYYVKIVRLNSEFVIGLQA